MDHRYHSQVRAYDRLISGNCNRQRLAEIDPESSAGSGMDGVTDMPGKPQLTQLQIIDNYTYLPELLWRINEMKSDPPKKNSRPKASILAKYTQSSHLAPLIVNCEEHSMLSKLKSNQRSKGLWGQRTQCPAYSSISSAQDSTSTKLALSIPWPHHTTLTANKTITGALSHPVHSG